IAVILIVVPTVEISTREIVREDESAHRNLCRWYVCDDYSLITREFDHRFEKRPGAIDKAVEIAREVLARDPASPDRWSELGDALQQAGRVAEAKACFLRALSLGPRD